MTQLRLPIAVLPAVPLEVSAFQLIRPGVSTPVWSSTAWLATRESCNARPTVGR